MTPTARHWGDPPRGALATMIVAGALLAAGLAVAGPSEAQSSSLDDWSHTREVHVHNPSSSSLQDHPIRLVFDSKLLVDQGLLQPDCADLRFKQGSFALAHWTQSGCGSSNTVVWIQIHQLDAESNGTLTMFFGNASATDVSDGEATFSFFDGFDTDPGYPHVGAGSGTYTVNGSTIQMTQTGTGPGVDDVRKLSSSFNVTGDGSQEFRARLNVTGPGDVHTVGFTDSPGVSERRYSVFGSAPDIRPADQNLSSAGQWGEVSAVLDDFSSEGPVTLGQDDADVQAQQVYDWILVRDRVSPEPTAWVDTDAPEIFSKVRCATPGDDGWCRASSTVHRFLPIELGRTELVETFEGSIGSEWSNSSTTTTAGGDTLLGRFGGQDQVFLNLTGLPEHSTLSVSYDLYTVGSVDGNAGGSGPDRFLLDLDETRVMDTTLSVGSSSQCYTDDCPASHPAGTGAYAWGLDDLQVNGQFTSVYRVAERINHTNSSTTIAIGSDLTEGLSDESWAIDNVHVVLNVSGLERGQPICSIDGGSSDSQNCWATISTDGVHTVDATALDRTGNQGTASRTVKIDSVAPSVGISASCSDPGDDGWCLSEITATFSASDATSGIATETCTIDGSSVDCDADHTLTDGDHTLEITAEDQAGNTASDSTSVKLDTTDPVVTTDRSCDDPGDDGWCLGTATGSGNASDATSGIDTVDCELDPTPSSGGGGAGSTSCSRGTSEDGTYTFTFTATDRAGNQNSGTETLKIDGTDPSITFEERTPAPNENGWNNEDVTLEWSCSDDTSGTVSTNVSKTLTTEGADQSATGTCEDQAGNTASDTQTGIDIDKTDPSSSSSLAGDLGDNGWYISPVDVTLSASDALSGVDKTEYRLDGGTTQTYSSTFTVATDGNHDVKFWSTDKADNQEPDPSTAFQIDTTDPAVSISAPCSDPGDDGWCLSEITATFSASDATSGIATETCTIDGSPVDCDADHTLTDGDHTLEITATDAAGNNNTTQLSRMVDATDPTIEITLTCETGGEPGWCRDDSFTYDVAISDPTSGIAEQTCTVDGQSAPCQGQVSGQGNHTIAAQATDQAGNTNASEATLGLDDTDPVVSLSTTCPKEADPPWCATGEKVHANASDATSGLADTTCTLDGEPITCDDPVVTEEGELTYRIEARDRAGNTASDEVTFHVDIEAPQVEVSTTCDAPERNGWCTGILTATIDVQDAGSGLNSTTCHVDGREILCNATIERTQPGERTLTVTSTDEAGNEDSVEVPLRIDPTPPGASIEIGCQDPGEPGWCRSASFSYNASTEDTTSGIDSVVCTLDGNSTSCNGTVTAPGNHTIVLEAEDTAGNNVTVERDIALDPSRPTITDVTAGPGAQNATTTWEAPDDPIGDVSGYKLYRANAANGPFHAIANLGDVRSARDSTLEPNTTVFYRVTALGEAGESRPSNALGTTTPIAVPSEPTNVTTSPAGPDTVRVDWDPPTNDGGDPLETYRVYRGASTDAMHHEATVPASQTNFTDNATAEEGEEPTGFVFFRINATNGAGEGPASETVRYPPEPQEPDSGGTEPSTASGAFERAWSRTTGDGPLDAARAIAVHPTGSIVYVVGTTTDAGAERTIVQAFGAENGPTIWSTAVPTATQAPDRPAAIAVDPLGRTVLVTTSLDGELATLALDAETGEIDWIDRYDGPLGVLDRPADLALDETGDRLYVTGTSTGAHTDADGVTLAYDAVNGTRLWVERIESAGEDLPVALAVDDAHERVHVLATSAGDALTLTYDADTGTERWRHLVDGGQADHAADLALSPGGDHLAVTITRTSLVGAEATVTLHDAATGAPLWTRSTLPTAGLSTVLARHVEITPDGETVVASAETATASVNATNAVAAAWNLTTGDSEWSRELAGQAAGDDSASALGVSPEGKQVYLAGRTWTDTGQADLRVVGLARGNGTPIWSDVAGGQGPETVHALATGSDARLYVAGQHVDGTGDADLFTLAYAQESSIGTASGKGSSDQAKQAPGTPGSGTGQGPIEETEAPWPELDGIPLYKQADEPFRDHPSVGQSAPVCMACLADKQELGSLDLLLEVVADREIGEDETVRFENKTLVIAGDIEVRGVLILRNVTLEFLETSEGIELFSGGVLDSDDSVLQASTAQAENRAPFTVDAKNGSTLEMVNTTVFGGQGVQVATDDTTFVDNVFENNERGLVLDGVDLSIAQNAFLANDIGIFQKGGDSTISNTTFKEGLIGVETQNATSNITGSTFLHNTLGVLSGDSEGSITDNLMLDRHEPPGGGIFVFDSNSPVIKDNIIGATGTGIAVRDARAWIVNNTVEDNVHAGIEITRNSAPMHVRSNTVRVNALHGIQLVDTQNVSVQDNTIEGNAASGIHVDGADAVDLTGNQITANGADGIAVQNAPGIRVQGNQILGNALYGIRAAPSAANLDLVANQVLGRHVKGIAVHAFNASLEDNRVVGALDTGIDVRGDLVSLADDRVSMSATGVRVALADGVTIDRLETENNTGDGIRLVLTTGTRIHQVLTGSNQDGITTSGTLDVEVSCTRVFDNVVDGVRNELGDPAQIRSSWIEGNQLFGANNLDSGTMDARKNYWGAADGPSTVSGGGSGDRVSLNVQFDPFLEEAPSCTQPTDGVQQASTPGEVDDEAGIPTVNLAPKADFTHEPEQPKTHQTVHFNSSSEDPDGAVTAWSWDFGDGATAKGANVEHVYDEPGTYTVTLTITDDRGARDTTAATVTVEKSIPFAQIGWTTDDPTRTLPVAFEDRTESGDPPIVSWSWSFGDGDTSSEQDPVHTYEQAGTYQVELTVQDLRGRTDTTTRTIEVDQLPQAPTVNLEASLIGGTDYEMHERPPVTVAVRDGQGTGLEGAIVEATVTHDATGKTTHTGPYKTNADGVTLFLLPYDTDTSPPGQNLPGKHTVEVTARTASPQDASIVETTQTLTFDVQVLG